MKTRIEYDSLGEVEVPVDALYGAQTRRAELNFPISGWRMPSRFIVSLAMIKHAFAKAHQETKKLDKKISDLIQNACDEIISGKHFDEFIVDVFQTGSGTSTNMNMNEVISNIAAMHSGNELGSRKPVHPNDHVNMGHSSNDAIPTALHISVALAITQDLIPALKKLEKSLTEKSDEFDDVIKIARTHLMDATPIRMGQVFSGYASQIRNSFDAIDLCLKKLKKLPIGGTAVGTGLNTTRDITDRVIEIISDRALIEFSETKNHFEAQASKDAIVLTASTLKTIAISIGKIANDIRFLASGPRCGIGEITLPAIQPGSSMMPGKINPVISESVLQMSAYVIGVDASISHSAATLSNFELNVAMPLMAYQLLESIRIMSNTCNIFVEKCIDGLQVNRERCEEMLEKSIALSTALVPVVGYDKASEIAKEAFKTGKTIRDIAYEREVADRDAIDTALDARKMTEPD